MNFLDRAEDRAGRAPGRLQAFDDRHDRRRRPDEHPYELRDQELDQRDRDDLLEGRERELGDLAT